jgi:hypothetical protein
LRRAKIGWIVVWRIPEPAIENVVDHSGIQINRGIDIRVSHLNKCGG